MSGVKTHPLESYDETLIIKKSFDKVGGTTLMAAHGRTASRL